MNNQYQEYILKSLEYDYNDFLKYIEETYPNHCTNGYSKNMGIWHFDELKYNEFILIKGNSSRESIKITVKYSNYANNLEIKSISSNISGDYTIMNIELFKDIIYKYHMSICIKDIQGERDQKRKSFQKMLDVVGKELKRDDMINRILENE